MPLGKQKTIKFIAQISVTLLFVFYLKSFKSK